MFQLTSHDLRSNLKSQIVISSWGGSRHLPYAFTEQGVAMLSSVLRSPTAIKINIDIMRCFVNLRKTNDSYKALQEKLLVLEREYEGHFKIIFEAINQLLSSNENATSRRIGFHDWE